jgi:hypothetical protein
MSSSCPSVNGFEPGPNERSLESTGVPDGGTGSETPLDTQTLGVSVERSSNRAPMPFVWQHGTQLILLDDEPDGWVMAELRFDADLCRYVEVRRAVYEETREAIGAVLSRALSSGDHAAVDSALSLHTWSHTYFGISIVSDVIARPDARYLEFTV